MLRPAWGSDLYLPKLKWAMTIIGNTVNVVIRGQRSSWPTIVFARKERGADISAPYQSATVQVANAPHPG